MWELACLLPQLIDAQSIKNAPDLSNRGIFRGAMKISGCESATQVFHHEDGLAVDPTVQVSGSDHFSILCE